MADKRRQPRRINVQLPTLEPEAPRPRWHWAAAAAALLVLATVPYLHVLNGGWFYDDFKVLILESPEHGNPVHPQIIYKTLESIRNPLLPGDPPLANPPPRPGLLTIVKDVILEMTGHKPGLEGRQRGLTFLTYYMDYRLGWGDPRFEMDPFPFHVTNLVIQALTVLAVWWSWIGVSKRLGVTAFWPAALGTALFAIHPLATEVVNYPSARPIALVGLFTFAALALVYASINSAGWSKIRGLFGSEAPSGGNRWIQFTAAWAPILLCWFGVAVCLALGRYSKEIGLIAPVLLIGGCLYITEVHRAKEYPRLLLGLVTLPAIALCMGGLIRILYGKTLGSLLFIRGTLGWSLVISLFLVVGILGFICALRLRGLRPVHALLLGAVPVLAITVLSSIWFLSPALQDWRPGNVEAISMSVRTRMTQSGVVPEETFGLGEPFEYNLPNFLMTQTRSQWKMISLVIIPWGRQNIDHAVKWSQGFYQPPSTPYAIIGVILLWGALAVLPFLVKRGSRMALVGLAIMLLGYLPYVIVPDLQPVLEYRFLISLPGAVLILAAGILGALAWFKARGMEDAARTVPIVAVVILAAFLAGTYMRNRDWMSTEALWQDSLNKTPGRLRVRNELALSFYRARMKGRKPDQKPDQEKIKKALDMFEGILTDTAHGGQNFLPAIVNTGFILATTGRRQEAIKILQRMQVIGKTNQEGIQLLAQVYEQEGRWPEAMSVNGDIVRQMGNNAPLCASAQEAMKRLIPRVQQEVGKALQEGKQDMAADLMGKIAKAECDAHAFEQALESLEMLRQINPQAGNSYMFLRIQGDSLFNLKRPAEAAAVYRKAWNMIAVNPRNNMMELVPLARFYLEALLAARDMAGAAEFYRQAQSVLDDRNAELLRKDYEERVWR